MTLLVSFFELSRYKMTKAYHLYNILTVRGRPPYSCILYMVWRKALR